MTWNLVLRTDMNLFISGYNPSFFYFGWLKVQFLSRNNMKRCHWFISVNLLCENLIFNHFLTKTSCKYQSAKSIKKSWIFRQNFITRTGGELIETILKFTLIISLYRNSPCFSWHQQRYCENHRKMVSINAEYKYLMRLGWNLVKSINRIFWICQIYSRLFLISDFSACQYKFWNIF